VTDESRSPAAAAALIPAPTTNQWRARKRQVQRVGLGGPDQADTDSADRRKSNFMHAPWSSFPSVSGQCDWISPALSEPRATAEEVLRNMGLGSARPPLATGHSPPQLSLSL
jgi:hypothetical protein